MLFQDHGAVGRIPVLVPVNWDDGWPILGENGKVPNKMPLPANRYYSKDIIVSDEFDQENLALQWQWNHNPVDSHWSLTARQDWLRLTASSVCNCLSDARNTLTQRTFGPVCSGSVLIDVSSMKNGDVAGLAALQDQYAFVGVKMKNDEKYITMAAAPDTSKDDGIEGLKTYRTGVPEIEIEAIPLERNIVYLRIDFNFTDAVDEADFYYSLCGNKWICIGNRLKMTYRLSHFTGYRFALFNFATGNSGGYVDFDWFRVSREVNKNM
jgi:beta-xylosidase